MNKKIVLVILLVVFLTGIAIAPVNAKKHTYKYGKYKFTITEKQYKKLKRGSDETYVYAKTVGKHKYTTWKVYKNFKYAGKKRYKVYGTISKMDGKYWLSVSCDGGYMAEKQIKHF